MAKQKIELEVNVGEEIINKHFRLYMKKITSTQDPHMRFSLLMRFIKRQKKAETQAQLGNLGFSYGPLKKIIVNISENLTTIYQKQLDFLTDQSIRILKTAVGDRLEKSLKYTRRVDPTAKSWLPSSKNIVLDFLVKIIQQLNIPQKSLQFDHPFSEQIEKFVSWNSKEFFEASGYQLNTELNKKFYVKDIHKPWLYGYRMMSKELFDRIDPPARLFKVCHEYFEIVHRWHDNNEITLKEYKPKKIRAAFKVFQMDAQVEDNKVILKNVSQKHFFEISKKEIGDVIKTGFYKGIFSSDSSCMEQKKKNFESKDSISSHKQDFFRSKSPHEFFEAILTKSGT